jgi:hypothetical protein
MSHLDALRRTCRGRATHFAQMRSSAGTLPRSQTCSGRRCGTGRRDEAICTRRAPSATPCDAGRREEAICARRPLGSAGRLARNQVAPDLESRSGWLREAATNRARTEHLPPARCGNPLDARHLPQPAREGSSIPPDAVARGTRSARAGRLTRHTPRRVRR